MLTGDYLARQLVRLKTPEAWKNEGDGLLFLFSRRGAGRYTSSCHDTSHELLPGDVAVLSARSNGQVSVLNGGELMFYCFSAPLEHLVGLFAANEVCLLQGLVHLFERTRHYAASTDLARECHKLIESTPPELTFQHRCHLLEVVSAIFSAELDHVRPDRGGMGASDEHFIQVLDGLSSTDIVSLSVQDLAGRFGWSRRHLNRVFQQHFGTSMAELKMELRLLKAVDLLVNPDSKVISVAEQCGFNHLGLFNTCFKKRFGVSPGRWRKLSSEAKGQATGQTNGRHHSENLADEQGNGKQRGNGNGKSTPARSALPRSQRALQCEPVKPNVPLELLERLRSPKPVRPRP